MKKITLIIMLLAFGGLSAQNASLGDLLERLETKSISSDAVSNHFNPTELTILKKHFRSLQGEKSIQGGGVLAYGWESGVFGYGSFDLDIPETFDPISAGSGTFDFESAGAVNPANIAQAFAMDNAGVLYEVAIETGIYTVLSTSFPLDATGMEYNPVDNVLYMTTTTDLYTIDTDALTSTLVGPLNTGGAVAIALAIDGAGNAYTYDIVDDNLYSIDLSTGNATLIGFIGFDAGFGQGMAWDPSEDRILMAAFNVTAFDGELRSVDVATGATTLIGAIIPGETTQLSWLTVAFAIPFNDDPITATTLGVRNFFEDSPRVGDNTEATDSAVVDPTIPEPSCSTYGGGDLWYKITVPDSGDVTLETRSDEGSPITDTAMSIYEGTIDALVEVDCDDDGGNGLFSLIALEGRTPGEVLYLRVFEFEGDTVGTFLVSAYDTPPPANDDLDGAIALTVGAMFMDFPEVGRNTSATASEVGDPTITDPTCSSYVGGDVWFSVQVPSTGDVTIETNRVEGSAITDTGMSVYEGEIGALVEVECDDDDSEDGFFSLIALTGRTPGETLYIRVFEFDNNAFGEFQVAAYSDCAVDGGSIELTDSGETGLTVCSEGSNPIDVTLGDDAFGDVMGWLITDAESGEILGLPAAPPFDLSDAGEGVCNIWSISYEDGLTGLEVGGNAADLAGCFDLSNPIVVTRVPDVCPPANSDCENAIEIFCDDTIAGTTLNATDSGSNLAGDVFYTYVTPADEAQEVTLSLCDGGTTYDSFLRVFDDGCTLVSEIAQNDDSCGLQSELTFTAELGMTYTIMVEGFDINTGDFSLAVTCDPVLSVDSAQLTNFSFYPNPAQERINLDAQQSIEQVTIFNMLGQKVLDQKIGVANTQLDVSNLSTGNYIMQVVIDGQKGVYQLLKQ